MSKRIKINLSKKKKPKKKIVPPYTIAEDVHPKDALNEGMSNAPDIDELFDQFLTYLSINLWENQGNLTNQHIETYWDNITKIANKCETVLEFRHNSMHIIFQPKDGKRMALFRKLREHAIASELRR